MPDPVSEANIEQEILERLCDQAMQNLFVRRETIMADLATWAVEPVWQEGALIGAVLRREAELHFATFLSVPIGRSIIAKALHPQMERYGHVDTRTPILDERQHRFNRMIGFRAVGQDAYDVHYRMEKDQCRLRL